MSDTYQYIDTDIFESLRTLKNDIFSAPLQKSFLRKSKFKNRDSLVNCAEIINKVIQIKNKELVDYIEHV